MAKTGLGRGFDSLIPTDILDESFDTTASNDRSSDMRQILIKDVSPNPNQPRRIFDEAALAELTESIKEHGLLQPLVVAPLGDGKFQIVAGERRWRAAALAGLSRVPAIVRTINEQHKLEIALVENIQRTDLNLLEAATAYLKLHTQFNLSYQQISKRVGKSSSTINNIVRLLQLPEDAKKAVAEGKISEGHARQIVALDGDEDAQATLLKLIINNHWSVRKAEQYVTGYRKGTDTDTRTKAAINSTKAQNEFTRSLSSRLSLPVVHKTMGHGGGQIIIKYRTAQELENLQKSLS